MRSLEQITKDSGRQARLSSRISRKILPYALTILGALTLVTSCDKKEDTPKTISPTNSPQQYVLQPKKQSPQDNFSDLRQTIQNIAKTGAELDAEFPEFIAKVRECYVADNEVTKVEEGYLQKNYYSSDGFKPANIYSVFVQTRSHLKSVRYNNSSDEQIKEQLLKSLEAILPKLKKQAELMPKLEENLRTKKRICFEGIKYLDAIPIYFSVIENKEAFNRLMTRYKSDFKTLKRLDDSFPVFQDLGIENYRKVLNLKESMMSLVDKPYTLN